MGELSPRLKKIVKHNPREKDLIQIRAPTKALGKCSRKPICSLDELPYGVTILHLIYVIVHARVKVSRIT